MRNRQIVLIEIQKAVADERQCQLRVLHLLREVECDGHYLEMGYPSLFEFATQKLGYSAGSAHRRIQAMRLIKAMPEMESKIENGTLSLCVAAKTQNFFRNEDQKRRDEGGLRLTAQAKQEIAQSVLGSSLRECEKVLAKISPESALPAEKLRELAQGKTLIQFSATAELMEKFEKLKGFLAHQNPDSSFEGLFECLAELALKKLEPQAPKPEEPENNAEVPFRSTMETKQSRYFPVEVKRRVFARDQGSCTYQDERTGKRCGSRFKLEYDHIQPFAWGGATDEINLRLRCRAHNAYTAKKQGLKKDSRA